MTILSIAGSLLISMASCSSLDSIDNETVGDNDGNETPTGSVATLYTTTSDGFNALKMSKSAIMTGVNMAPTTIQIDPSQTFQKMDGFGFAITYSTCYNLMKMSTEARSAFLKQTYSVSDGYGVSYARISIGCNDFSSTEYTLCDEKGLENFSLYKDETDYVIPILKEILAINPDVKIIAAPWTCPKWMKVDDIESKTPHDAWTDGHLNPDYYGLYAQYFVKFVQEMKKQGIDIYAVSPQNEPLNKANCASLYMPWQEEAPFVKELARAFKQNGIA
ncbi:MAG: glucosylceramidase, partial [Prevotella sp.]